MKSFTFVSGIALVVAVRASSAGVQDEAAPQKVSYDGYQVLRVPVSHETLPHINRAIDELNLGTWQDARKAGRFADVVVAPEQSDELAARLSELGLATETKTMHRDLGASIADEANYEAYGGSPNLTWFHSFHPYKDHMQWLHDLQALYPNNTEIVSSGKSLNGRDITGIRLFGANSSSGNTGKRNPAVVFHGTVHAREWIATMVVEYLAYQLLTGYAVNGSAPAANAPHGFLDRYDVYAFPVVNPDGFIYTQTNDRLWRKNRQNNTGNACVGRDINRNWPIAWNSPGGSSTNPCAQDFRGGAQADAPETVALTTWLQATQKRQGVDLYIDYHSYGQLFMTPYGYTCEQLPRTNDELQALANGASAAIYAAHGLFFQAGGICSMLYKAAGNSVDYVYDVIGARYSFTSELRDMGQTGFVLPPAQILPSCEESWAGVRYLLENIK